MPINGWVSPFTLASLLASHNTKKNSKNYKETLRKPKLHSAALPPHFFPKVPLNRSTNPITS